MSETEDLRHSFGVAPDPQDRPVILGPIIAIKPRLKTQCPFSSLLPLNEGANFTMENIKRSYPDRKRCFLGFTYHGYTPAFMKHLIQPQYTSLDVEGKAFEFSGSIYGMNYEQLSRLIDSWEEYAREKNDQDMIKAVREIREEAAETRSFIHTCGLKCEVNTAQPN